MVDSGANVSILSKETVEKWPYSSRPDIYPVQTSLITVTGESTPFHGKTEVDICLGRQKIAHEFLIADIKYGGILGMDFLMKHKCDIMLSKGYIVLRGERIPCYMNENKSDLTCCRVAVSETVVIPAESEMIIPGKPLDPIDNEYFGILEPHTNFVHKNGLLVGKSLVDPLKGTFPIRVANFKKEPCKIYENTVAAVYESVSVLKSESVSSVNTEPSTATMPEHIQDLFTRSSKTLEPEQVAKLKALLIKHQNVFSSSKLDIGGTDLVSHTIETGDPPPIKS